MRHRAFLERPATGRRSGPPLGRRRARFLIGDAVGCAVAGQKVPDGRYHLDRMVESAARRGADVGCCGTCLDARGIATEALVKGATLDDLAGWTAWADQVITF
ncbi:DsrE/DsrF/TusD sulfur relay family protein [Amycolatopsis mongoliensis]|uniref:DsrE/DsrF/TusD sulfur relay family protein n=1 Tax=Amycolatopsis mongoliensis TaxID=715475 RepID=UPI0038CC0A14